MKALKICRKCGLEAHTQEELESFKKRSRDSYGRESMCKECDNNRRFAMYGITKEEYTSLILDQDNQCLLCTTVFSTTPHIDHDHITGKVRGLLCQKCNNGIGLLQDSPAVLRKAANYIEYWRTI